ncbi:adenylate/guanylate cyclase domain-containing protein [Algoriphagus hitonicola]|uniref:Adenylate cyclase, class 3 n=1 Tax=Algoriphagus hitonicola TaxID=435880 RepID=A0A1I2RD10_9BACT|nr:adenylate/guanylate cyclase domain-containing protein [Algoriphagus hitonicola]SFG38615.1 Adenylate cyclase, class 3 [Algoriphagus hitonicola]
MKILSLVGIVGAFLLIFNSEEAVAQDQKKADSLLLELKNYPQKAGSDTLRLYLLSNISFNYNNPDSALFYAEMLTEEALEQNLSKWIFSGYFNQGSVQRLLGNLDLASQNFFKSLEYTQDSSNFNQKGKAYLAIADVYSISGVHQNSVDYYRNAIDIFTQTGDETSLATAYLNIGDEFFSEDQYDSAIYYFEKSEVIFEKINYLTGKAYNLGNLGMVYAKLGQNPRAEANFNEAVELLQSMGDYYPISVYNGYMAEIYAAQQNYPAAITYATTSNSIAEKFGFKEQIRDASQKLAAYFEETGNLAESYRFFKKYAAYKDSINNLKAIQELADLRTNLEVSQKQAEVELLEKESELNLLKTKRQEVLLYSAGGLFLFAGIIAVGVFKKYRYERKTKQIIESEKDRSEKLLLNILPADIANELKENGKVKARKYEAATVMFTDFKNFTKASEDLDPELIVQSIDYYFSKFDEIVEKHGLEKIKTIGDAYMCAGGIPIPNTTHVMDAINAAKEMCALVRSNPLSQVHRFEMRIGIHTGPVVAGIVGTKKWQYDIWGDTVNIASRLESSSEPGRINISEHTYELIRSGVNCQYRGKIEIKNHGAIDMYFLKENIS